MPFLGYFYPSFNTADIVSGSVASGDLGDAVVVSGNVGSGAILGRAGGGYFNIASGSITTNDIGLYFCFFITGYSIISIGI